MTIPDTKRLEAIAYTIAGLDVRMAAAKAGISRSVLYQLVKDKILRRRAMTLYLAAVADARANARPRSRKVKEILKDQSEARRLATQPKSSRHAYAKAKAASEAAKKVVVVQQHPVIVLAEEDEDSMDLDTALEKLKGKFKVKDTRQQTK